MKELKEISISEVSDAIDLIGKEWMLIGAPDGEGANAMTASWGTLGVLWNKPVCKTAALHLWACRKVRQTQFFVFRKGLP